MVLKNFKIQMVVGPAVGVSSRNYKRMSLSGIIPVDLLITLLSQKLIFKFQVFRYSPKTHGI